MEKLQKWIEIKEKQKSRQIPDSLPHKQMHIRAKGTLEF